MSTIAVDVHRVRTADAFTAGASQRQRVVVLLDAHDRVEQHPIARLERDVVALHVRLFVDFRVVAED